MKHVELLLYLAHVFHVSLAYMASDTSMAAYHCNLVLTEAQQTFVCFDSLSWVKTIIAVVYRNNFRDLSNVNKSNVVFFLLAALWKSIQYMESLLTLQHCILLLEMCVQAVVNVGVQKNLKFYDVSLRAWNVRHHLMTSAESSSSVLLFSCAPLHR